METHEKEKRGKLAELMYELLDFGRMEQLARDIWDKAPESVQKEVADLFAARVKSEIQRQSTWVEQESNPNRGYSDRSPPPKPMMQVAFEKIAQQAVDEFMKQHGDEIRASLLASAQEQMKARIEKESSWLLDGVFRKMREGVDKALRGF